MCTNPMATKIALSSNLSPIIDNIIEALAPHISAGQIAILRDKISKNFQAPSVRNDVRREIGQLANILCTIEENFSTIDRHLRRIDENELVIVDGKPKVYATQWEKLHEEYTQIVQISQETANKTKSKIRELVSVVIPILQSSTHVDAKRQELERYISNLFGFEAEASEVENRFSGLGKNVDVFRQDLKKTVAHQIASGSSNVDKRIAEIDAEIVILRGKLESIGGFYRGAKNVVKLATPVVINTVGPVAAAGGAILAAVGGLAALAPAVAGGLLAAAIAGTVGYSVTVGVMEHNTQKTKIKKGIKDLADEREKFTAIIKYKHPTLLSVSQEFNRLDIIFDEIIGRLFSIQDIWHMLLIDTQNLRKDLDDLKSIENNDAFGRKLSSAKGLFDTLYFALDEYTLQVQASKF